jgi:hypothetical protein
VAIGGDRYSMGDQGVAIHGRLHLVTADGAIVEASRSSNADLFRAAIGGYGAVGVITEVELDVAENASFGWQGCRRACGGATFRSTELQRPRGVADGPMSDVAPMRAD